MVPGVDVENTKKSGPFNHTSIQNQQPVATTLFVDLRFFAGRTPQLLGGFQKVRMTPTEALRLSARHYEHTEQNRCR